MTAGNVRLLPLFASQQTLNIMCIMIGQEFLQVLDWLSPLTCGSKQNNTFEERQDGTGEWFLQSHEFQS